MGTREITKEEYWQGKLTRPAGETPSVSPAWNILGNLRVPAVFPTTKKEHMMFTKTIMATVLIGMGMYLPGTYTGMVIERMTGPLAMLFYTYQLGSVMVAFGAILLYDTWVRRR